MSPTRGTLAGVVAALLALETGCGPSAGTAGVESGIALGVSKSARLEVSAAWDPIREWSQGMKDKFPGFFEYEVALPLREYAGSDFEAFLPDHPVKVGEIWPIEVERTLPFWRQFSPEARPTLHHGKVGQGGYACLRAADEVEAEVIFRMHGEYVLKEGKVFFTPGQFAGRLLLDRKTGAVRYFRMWLPDRRPNVDVNVAFEHEYEVDGVKKKGFAFDADIVYVPRMELEGGATRRPADDRAWTAWVEEEEARERLKERFYRAEQVTWMSVDDAARVSKETGKPMHMIVMFGTLDDESC